MVSFGSMEALLQFAVGLIALGFMIFIHELGHFAVAKWAKVKVNTFSIGFGPKLLKYKYGETTYCISAIPFGGYVAMENETPTDATRSYSEGDFATKPIWVRAAIAFAGPAVNIVFALFLVWILYMIGVPEPRDKDLIVGRVEAGAPAMVAGVQSGDQILSVNGRIPKDWDGFVEEVAMNLGKNIPLHLQRGGLDTTLFVTPREMVIKGKSLGVGDVGIYPGVRVFVRDIVPESPALAAGLRAGDTLLKLNGKELYSPMDFIQGVQTGNRVTLEVQSGGQTRVVDVTPRKDPDGVFRVGVQMGIPMDTTAHGAGAAFDKALAKNVDYALAPLRFLQNLFTGGIKLEAMSGPVGIAQAVGKTWSMGWMEFCFLMAMISMNLGIMNLLPLAITDGGILMFLALEAIRGKPLSIQVQAVIQRIAVAFFLTLFAYILLQDILRIPLFLN